MSDVCKGRAQPSRTSRTRAWQKCYRAAELFAAIEQLRTVSRQKKTTDHKRCCTKKLFLQLARDAGSRVMQFFFWAQNPTAVRIPGAAGSQKHTSCNYWHMSQITFRAGAERGAAPVLPLQARRDGLAKVRRAACALAFVPIKRAAPPSGSGTRACCGAAWAEHLNLLSATCGSRPRRAWHTIEEGLPAA